MVGCAEPPICTSWCWGLVLTGQCWVQVILDTLEYATRIKKTPVVVGNCTGFAVNRVFFPYTQVGSAPTRCLKQCPVIWCLRVDALPGLNVVPVDAHKVIPCSAHREPQDSEQRLGYRA